MEKHHIFGTVKVGDRGQIVIPKEARDMLGIKPGDTMLVLQGKRHGIMIVKADLIKEFARKILEGIENGSKK